MIEHFRVRASMIEHPSEYRASLKIEKKLSNVGWGIAPILHINFGPLKRLAILNRTDVNEILTIYEFMMLTMFLCQIGVIFFLPRAPGEYQASKFKYRVSTSMLYF